MNEPSTSTGIKRKASTSGNRNVMKQCPKCFKVMRSDSVARHIKNIHEKTCKYCGIQFDMSLGNHQRTCRASGVEVLNEGVQINRNPVSKIDRHREVNCPICEKSMRSDNLKQHLKHCDKDKLLCPVCYKSVSSENREQHRLVCGVQKYQCRVCNESFNAHNQRVKHEAKCRQSISDIQPSSKTQRKCNQAPAHEEALGGLFRVIKIVPEKSPDYEAVLQSHHDRIVDILTHELEREKALKFNLCIKLDLQKMVEISISERFTFTTRSTILLPTTDIDDQVREHCEQLLEKIDIFNRRGSGWVMNAVDCIHIDITKYNPLGGGTYIKLPKEIANKTSLLNIQNNDQFCLKWCILAAKHPAEKDGHRVTKYYEYAHELDFTGITWPVQLKDIPTIERLNNLSINVYGWSDAVGAGKKVVGVKETIEEKRARRDRNICHGFYPLHISNIEDVSVTHIDLLLIANEHTQHYVLITSLSGLLSTRTGKNYTHKRFYCHRCLHGFTKVEGLNTHHEDCKRFKIQKTVFPEESHIEFKSYRKQIKHPVYIVADFEAIVEPISTTQTDPTKSGSFETARQVACGFAYKVVSHIDGYDKPVVVHRGLDAPEYFVQCIHDEYENLKELLYSNVKMDKLTPRQKFDHYRVSRCCICEKVFSAGEWRVRDHCHYTGKYNGPAHNLCNMEKRTDKRLPIIFHNFKGYDSHLLIRDLCKMETDTTSVRLIPKTMEKYTSVITKEFKFIDSYQHLTASLSSLVDNVTSEGLDGLIHLKAYIHEHYQGEDEDEKVRLISRKGVYPYSYMTNMEKFNEGLPTQDQFYDSLNNEALPDQDYGYVQELWDEFGLENLGDLHDLYVITDVLLLADVFENYRNECLAKFRLDPIHYYTLPGFTWDACLYMTKAKLQLIKDVDMYLFMERGIRGGISVISQRHAIANNPEVSNFDVTKPSNYLIYVDANNLYGWAMSQKIPYDDIKWVPDNDLQLLTENNFKRIHDFDAEGDRGLILEVDVDIPENIHDKTNDYPLFPENMDITHRDISTASHKIRENRNAKNEFKSTKLAPNLYSKTRYIVHIRNLQFYISQGAKIIKIHRGVSFLQKDWIRPYIQYNTNHRQLATNEFEKAFHKLLNNAFFGKTMESVRKRIDIKLIQNAYQHSYQTSKPGYKRFSIFSEELVGVELLKPKVILDKPIYVGFSILDLSKLKMFDFHYNTMMVEYPKSKLCFTDTDSFLYDIPTNDLYSDLAKMKQHFDFSNYQKNHPLYSTENKAVVGKFKDECGGTPIREFVGLRSKMYSILTVDDARKHPNDRVKRKFTAAGVKKCVAKSLHHELYKDVLDSQTDVLIEQNLMRSIKHTVSNVTQVKIGLSAYDDKRFMLPNGVHTRAYGHIDNSN